MEHVRVEVVYATPERQELIQIQAESGATVRHVIEASGVLDEFPELDINSIETGIFSRPVPLGHRVNDGDRVEIYRPLTIDPKEARRRRAIKGDR